MFQETIDQCRYFEYKRFSEAYNDSEIWYWTITQCLLSKFPMKHKQIISEQHV